VANRMGGKIVIDRVRDSEGGNCVLWGFGSVLSGGMDAHLSVQNFLCVRLLSGNANSKI
jgi:hypothetical protein